MGMHVLVFVVALLTSAIFTRLVRDYAMAHKWVSVPNSDRHVHSRPVPRLGGVAIFLTLWCVALLAHFLPEPFSQPGFPLAQLALKILGPATIIFVLGLIDDFWGLSAYIKFVVQAGAAVLLFSNGLGISQLSTLAGHPHLGWLVGLPLTIVWVLWITNAFNLIDGLDGLAAGSALLSTLVSCVVAMVGHNEVVLILTLALAGAISGFLRYNFNPASIFLGDCGSLLIGFLISAIAIAGSHKSPTMVAVAIPIVSLGLPILEVAVAVVRRFLSCRRLFAPDREHIHHKLLRGSLERIAFDGFGLYFSAGLPFGVEFDPLIAVSRTKVQYFWILSSSPSRKDWSLTVSLAKKNGKQLGGFTLYRRNTASPLWMDLDIFTTTGFSAAIANCLEKMQKSWPK